MDKYNIKPLAEKKRRKTLLDYVSSIFSPSADKTQGQQQLTNEYETVVDRQGNIVKKKKKSEDQE